MMIPLARMTVLALGMAGGIAVADAPAATPATAPATRPADRLEVEGRVVLERNTHLQGRCTLVTLRFVSFTAEPDNSQRADVGYRFTDARVTAGARFRMKLLRANGEVLAEQVVHEPRSWPVTVERRGIDTLRFGGRDAERNAVFLFGDTRLAEAATYVLEVVPE